MSAKSTQLKNIVLTAGLVFAPLLSLSIIGGYLAKEEVRQQTLNGLETFASAQKARVEQHINNKHAVHNGIASRTQFKAHLEEFNATGSITAVEAMGTILSDAKAPFAEVKGLVLFGANSSIVVDQQGSKIPSDLHQKLVERGSKSFFVHPIDMGGNKVVLHSGPVKQGDNTIGVLVIIFSADGLQDITHSADGLGKTGETVIGYLNDSDDAVILFPTRLQTSSEPITLAKDSSLPVVPTLLDKKDNTFKTATDYREKKVVAATRYLEDTGWAVVTKKDHSEVFASLSTFMVIYIFIAAVIFGITLAGLVVKLTW